MTIFLYNFFSYLALLFENFFLYKYSFEVKILADNEFIIPEYKIELFSKSKKPISTIENINSIIQINKKKNNYVKSKKVKENLKDKDKDKVKKIKTKKKN